MPIIGPGYDDPESTTTTPPGRPRTPFRRWLFEKFAAAGCEYAADAAGIYAPANRYHGLDDINMGIATLTGISPDAVRAAHKADLADWAREQQFRDHPDLVAGVRRTSLVSKWRTCNSLDMTSPWHHVVLSR
ncbi:hypothetical protein ABR737_43685 [Streptomyces sp. Edi2]|uniref:hypothetical protein n=2 Tax=Streptomyces sp. Edi2 TaxID=3162528 RepID=UPI003305A29D